MWWVREREKETKARAGIYSYHCFHWSVRLSVFFVRHPNAMATVNRYEIYGGKFVPKQTHFIDAGD